VAVAAAAAAAAAAVAVAAAAAAALRAEEAAAAALHTPVAGQLPAAVRVDDTRPVRLREARAVRLREAVAGRPRGVRSHREVEEGLHDPSAAGQAGARPAACLEDLEVLAGPEVLVDQGASAVPQTAVAAAALLPAGAAGRHPSAARDNPRGPSAHEAAHPLPEVGAEVGHRACPEGLAVGRRAGPRALQRTAGGPRRSVAARTVSSPH
jgi:hypothetical protein